MRTYTADEVDAMIGRALARERERVAQQQEPVLWQILNGVCHAGVRPTENLAKEAAAGRQKIHDLGGSLAAFHVRPLYTAPQAQPAQRKPLTLGQKQRLWSSVGDKPTLKDRVNAYGTAIEAAHGITKGGAA